MQIGYFVIRIGYSKSFFYEFFYSFKKTLELINEKGYTIFKQILE